MDHFNFTIYVLWFQFDQFSFEWFLSYMMEGGQLVIKIPINASY